MYIFILYNTYIVLKSVILLKLTILIPYVTTLSIISIRVF